MSPAESHRAISVLVVDDEELLARSCVQILASEGYAVEVASRGRTALEAVRRSPPDLVLADLRLPDIDGMELLREVRTLSPCTLVIVVTGFATVDSSVEAMDAGAFDYIPKPFTATQLRIVAGRAAQYIESRRAGRATGTTGITEIVGGSEAMRKVLSVVARVARTDASVLLSGESGTGKELVAREIHERSSRSGRSFLAINCAALPDQLLESELFGTEKGAFTGADAQRDGLLEVASGGTFFLDEITEMSLELQAKLLRVIQERRIRRVGGNREIPIDVRWVSATNRDPEQAVRDGKLRQDLFFRLNVVPIRLPPLRARPADIGPLAEQFLARFSAEYDRPGARLSPGVLAALGRHTWPGNVRELQNVIERLVSLSSGGEITTDDLPEELDRAPLPCRNGDARSVQTDLPFHEAKAAAIAEFEKEYLNALLSRAGGNISQAAREAGVDRKTIHRMLSKHEADAGRN